MALTAFVLRPPNRREQKPYQGRTTEAMAEMV